MLLPLLSVPRYPEQVRQQPRGSHGVVRGHAQVAFAERHGRRAAAARGQLARRPARLRHIDREMDQSAEKTTFFFESRIFELTFVLLLTCF